MNDDDDDEDEATTEEQNYLFFDAVCFLSPLMMGDLTSDECRPICCFHISNK
jgi:hypothetical protein